MSLDEQKQRGYTPRAVTPFKCQDGVNLVDFLDCWTSASAGTSISTTRHTTIWRTTCSLVHFHHDRIHDAFKLLLLRLKLVFFGQLILIKPIKRFLDCFLDFILVITLKLILEFLLLERVTHCETIIFQAILGFDFFACLPHLQH